MKVVVLDYGVGNLFSLRSALEREGAVPVISSELTTNGEFDALILPGVGNFGPVAEKLSPLRQHIQQLVAVGFPVLGICLGMQILFDESEEAKGRGLSLLSGRVVRLPSSVKVPHMGWNNLRVRRMNSLLDGIESGAWVYFAHSYYPQPTDDDVVVADAEYGTAFAAVVARGNLYGTQFHPEKSGPAGRKLLQNFLEIARKGWKS